MNTVSRPRSKSLKLRFFEKTHPGPISSAGSDKPLPNTPQLVSPAIEAVLPNETESRATPEQNIASIQNSESSHYTSADRRRTRSFDDGTTGGNRFLSPGETPQKRPGTSLSKPVKSVAWVDSVDNRPATAHQPENDSFRGRSRSLGQLGSDSVEERPRSRSVLGSFAPFEKKKLLPTGGLEKTKDQLLHHLKTKKSLDILAVPVNKLRAASPRPSSARRDWPLSIFRAKSSNCLNCPEESVQFSDGENGIESEQQMEWSKPEDEIWNTHTLPGPSGSPRIPHIRASLCSPIREDLDEDKIDIKEEDDESGEGGDVESILTALPTLDSSLARNLDIVISQMTTEANAHELSLSSKDILAAPQPTDSIDSDANLYGPLSNTRRSPDSAASQPKRLVPHSADILGLSSSRPFRLRSKVVLAPIMQTDNDIKSGIAINVASLTSESLIDFLAATPPVSPRPNNPENSSTDDDLNLNQPSELKENTSSKTRLGLGIRVGLQAYPEEVSSPPPPGPGGRVMVTPDYSTQYALEGEKRLRTRRTLGVSGLSLLPRKRSFKRLFSPTRKSDNNNNCAAMVGTSSDTFPVSTSVEDMGTAYMDGRKKFHFRGLGRDGTWVMSN